MKSGMSKLKKILGIGAIALASFLPMKAQAQKYNVNSFVQPNDTTKPLVWDNLETIAERNAYFDDRLYNHDKTDTMTYIPGGFVCTDFASAFAINFNGYGELGFDPEKGLQNNGVHNIPVYTVTLMKPGKFHQINGVIPGDNVSDINDWRFIESETDSTYNLNTFTQAGVYKIVINQGKVINDDIQGKILFFQPFLEFIPDENWGWKDSGYRNPEINLIPNRSIGMDKTPVEIIASSPVPNSTYKEKDVNLEYILRDKEKNLDLTNSYYKFNDIENHFADSTGTIPLSSKQGPNKLEIYAKDLAGNSSNKTINYTYDPFTDLEDNTKNIEFKSYPNPVKNIGKFKFENSDNKEVYLEIYNSAGQLIGKEKTNENKIDYDFSNYSSGIYPYKLIGSKGKTYTGKVVKE